MVACLEGFHLVLERLVCKASRLMFLSGISACRGRLLLFEARKTRSLCVEMEIGRGYDCIGYASTRRVLVDA